MLELGRHDFAFLRQNPPQPLARASRGCRTMQAASTLWASPPIWATRRARTAVVISSPSRRCFPRRFHALRSPAEFGGAYGDCNELMNSPQAPLMRSIHCTPRRPRRVVGGPRPPLQTRRVWPRCISIFSTAALNSQRRPSLPTRVRCKLILFGRVKMRLMMISALVERPIFFPNWWRSRQRVDCFQWLTTSARSWLRSLARSRQLVTKKIVSGRSMLG